MNQSKANNTAESVKRVSQELLSTLKNVRQIITFVEENGGWGDAVIPEEIDNAYNALLSVHRFVNGEIANNPKLMGVLLQLMDAPQLQ